MALNPEKNPSLMGVNTTPARSMSPAVERAAALVVCGHATDPGDAREMLLMLGLIGPSMSTGMGALNSWD